MAGEQEELSGLEGPLTRFTVPEEAAGQRLDQFLAGATGLSRAKSQQQIEDGNVTVNGAAARGKEKLRAGDVVEAKVGMARVRTETALEPLAMALDIVYEDEHLLVVNKPAGIPMHPGAGTTGPTLVQGLLHHAGGKLSRGGGEPPPDVAEDEDEELLTRPGIVHRLDKDTTGLVVVAKTDKAHAALARQFHDKTNERAYLALLDGVMPQPEIVAESYLFRDPTNRMRFASLSQTDHDDFIAKHPGDKKRFRLAKSVFTREAEYGDRLTLARVRLHTGRTHQIRVHAAALRLHVVGDQLYHRSVVLPGRFSEPARTAVAAIGRQLLHAAVLGFIHPESGAAMRFEAPYPADFKEIIDLLAPLAKVRR